MSKTQTVNLPRHARAAKVRANTFNEADNTIDVVFTTGADVQRYDWMDGVYIERLLTEPANVNLDRLNAGAAFLDAHNAYELGAMIGSVVKGSARMEGGLGLCKVFLSQSARAADTVRDIRDGVINNVSVGYDVLAFSREESSDGSPSIMTATLWEPCEISAVPVPADPGAQIRAATRSASGLEVHPCTITRADPSTQEPMMADDPKTPAPVPDPKASPAPDPSEAEKKAAAEKAGLEPDAVKEVHQVPTGTAVNTEKATAVVDPGDALPVSVQRKLEGMLAKAVSGERERINEIRAMGRKHGLDDLAATHAERGTDVPGFKDIVLEKLAARFAEGPVVAQHGEASLEATRAKETGADWAKRLSGKK